MNGVVEVLAQHQMRGQGLTSTSPDRCSCGELTMPLPGDEDATVRRGRAFALHQAEVLSAAGKPGRPEGFITLGEDTVRALVEALQAMPPAAKVRVWSQYVTSAAGRSSADRITDVARNSSGEVELWV